MCVLEGGSTAVVAERVKEAATVTSAGSTVTTSNALDAVFASTVGRAITASKQGQGNGICQQRWERKASSGSP